MSSDACITSRAVSPRTTAIIQQQQRQRRGQYQHQHQQQHHQHQHQHQHQSSSYHAFDDGGASSSPLHTSLVLGGSHGFDAAAASQQHSAFNASLRLPLGVEIIPSTYPVARGTPRAFDHQTYSTSYPREPHPLSEVSQPPPQTAPQDSSMRYPHIDLPILNAETYSDGYQFKGPASRQTGSDSPPAEDAPAPRKRGRKEGSVDKNDIEEGKKRARGRPRLNPKDKTADERRRTQIRLAQRAYRHRKENAITELEAQVRDLKEVNDEMKDVFARLLASASRQGIAHAPEFGEHFLKLQTLIKRSREEGEGEDEDDESLPDIDAEEIGGGRGSQQSSAKAPSMQGSAIVEPRRNNQPEQLYGGLIVTHEPVPQHQPHTTADQAYHPSMPMHHPHDTSNAYQIIAAPTLENASFAGTNTSFLFGNSNAATPTSTSAAGGWTFSPWSTLPMPASVAYQEPAFARRLHRYATERAAYLICLKDPPQDKMMRVFGFARLFETTEMIRERTLAVLARTKDQSLQNWNYPFYNLGGAGTHFPARKDGGNGSGVGVDVGVGGSGSGIAGVGGSGDGNGIGGGGDGEAQTRGFRFGPMDEPTSHIRDSLLTISQNIRMPGLQGLFWDCDEVEWYMRQNGVIIPDMSADYCSVEVPAGSFFQYQEMRHREADLSTPVGGSGSVFPGSSASAGPSGMDDGSSWPQANTTGSNVLGAAQSGMGAGLLPGSELHNYAPHMPSSHVPGAASNFMGKVVQLNVSKFLDRLTSRAACLGRTPGFRPKDVDASFWESVMTGQN